MKKAFIIEIEEFREILCALNNRIDVLNERLAQSIRERDKNLVADDRFALETTKRALKAIGRQ